MAPESWKSASQQKGSQNGAMARRESQKFKTVHSSIGTVILKVCEGPESVTEKWNGLGRVCVCVGMCVRACVCVSEYVHKCIHVYVFMTVCDFPYF